MKTYIEELNKKLFQLTDKANPVLAQEVMEISIYFYYLSEIKKNDNYKIIAEQLLDNALGKLSLDTPLSIENGLAGTALGIINLIKAGFVEGDVNVLLEDIDNVIFKSIVLSEPNFSYSEAELLLQLYYLHVRLTQQRNEDNRYIYRELIIKVVNLFVVGLKDDFFNESFSFSVYQYHLPLFTFICACLLKQNIYNNRIYKILEELEPKIFSQLPVLHANRLYLLCGILPLVAHMKNHKWKHFADLLKKEINLQTILDKEMKNKHIFVSNGLSMIYLLLYYLENKYPEYKISYIPQIFYDKISTSEAWESLVKRDYFFKIHRGLLNGFPGVQLVLLHIQKNKK